MSKNGKKTKLNKSVERNDIIKFRIIYGIAAIINFYV